MTNPHVAKATALSYLTELFEAIGEGEVMTAEELAGHVFTNVRPGHDGYPFVKVVGKNRLAIEFDLDVKPVGMAATDDGVVDSEIVDENEPVSLWPAPTPAENPEGVDEDNLEDPEGHAATYGETGPEDVVNNSAADPEPVSESDWMAKGRAAAEKMDRGEG